MLLGPRSVARSDPGRKQFFRVEGKDGDATLLIKVFGVAPGLPRIRYWHRASKARREAEVARAVIAKGFEAAEPVAVGEERRWGVLLRSFSVIQFLPARDLRSILLDPKAIRIQSGHQDAHDSVPAIRSGFSKLCKFIPHPSW